MGGALSSTPKYDLQSKHVFLTGGANGIGLAMAKVLLQKSCRMTLVDVVDSSDAVAELDALIESQSLPGKIFAFKADVSKYDQMVKAVAAAEDALGPVDVLIPNAGIASSGLFLLETVEALERVNRVNLMGVIYTLKAALPGMVERGQGRILMMSSMMAMFGAFASSGYAAPKAAVLALSNALRLELLGTGVGITLAMPAFTNTGMAKVGLENPNAPALAKELTREMKMYTPEVVAELAVAGIEKGRYFADGPDFPSNLAVGSMAGTSPRVFPFIVELLLQPLYLIMHVTLTQSLEARILKWRRGGSPGVGGLEARPNKQE